MLATGKSRLGGKMYNRLAPETGGKYQVCKDGTGTAHVSYTSRSTSTLIDSVMGECDIYLMETEQVSKVCASGKVLRLLTQKSRLIGIGEDKTQGCNECIYTQQQHWMTLGVYMCTRSESE